MSAIHLGFEVGTGEPVVIPGDTARASRRFLMPDRSSRIDAVGWSIAVDGSVTVRIHDSEHELFWSFNRKDRDTCLTLLANLIEPLAALQRQLQ